MASARKLAMIVGLASVGALAGVTAAWAGGGGHCENSVGNGTTIELSGACFTATTSFVQPGETVTFVNRDQFLHNVSGSGWGHYEDMAGGETYSTSFADEGVFAFACTLHPGMTGSIVVGEGDSVPAAQFVEPAAASAVPNARSDGWVPAGALGILVGLAAGAGIAKLRRQRAIP